MNIVGCKQLQVHDKHEKKAASFRQLEMMNEAFNL